MQTLLKTLDYLLFHAEYWDVTNEGAYVAAIAGDTENYCFTESTVRDRNNLLPFIIQSLIERPNPYIYPGRDVADAGLVYATLMLLENGAVRFTEPCGNVLVLSEIEEITFSELETTPLVIAGNALTIEKVSYSGITIELAVKETWTLFESIPSEMNAKYPNWQKKWALGKDLGLDDRTLFASSFSNTSPASIEMTSVTFS